MRSLAGGRDLLDRAARIGTQCFQARATARDLAHKRRVTRAEPTPAPARTPWRDTSSGPQPPGQLLLPRAQRLVPRTQPQARGEAALRGSRTEAWHTRAPRP